MKKKTTNTPKELHYFQNTENNRWERLQLRVQEYNHLSKMIAKLESTNKQGDSNSEVIICFVTHWYLGSGVVLICIDS